MECTQKLECTQDLYETHSQRISPEEIGFLGICGTKYPVKKGPNKIGRDPQTCNVVLNLNSISRQHAVINVLNNNNFMIMDLDSANKTKVGGKTLQPYIPHPLKDGDTVQFGDVFGIFRLLDVDDDLPSTQAIDIPDTPMTNHCMSRINKVAITMVPESPDVSDREDSFVAPSQRGDKTETSHRFIKPSSKTISIQPIGSNKIDNVYWNSSKKSKSLSLSLNNSNVSVDDSDPTVINRLSSGTHDIYEMETQDPTLNKIESFGSIHVAETQIPEDGPGTSIYSQDTQEVPTTNTHMADIHKVNIQQKMEINLYISDKENKHDLHNAETQLYERESPNTSGTRRKKNIKGKADASYKSNDNINSSHEEIIFDEINTQSFDGPFESQSIIPEDDILNFENNPNIETNENVDFGNQRRKASNTRTTRAKSSDSTDCEDMETALTQIIPQNPNNSDEDVTDCEEIENESIKKNTDNKNDKHDTHNIEDLQTQVIDIEEPTKNGENFEDMATQILVQEQTESTVVKKSEEEINFEDLPTQILVEHTKKVDPDLVENPNKEINNTDLLMQKTKRNLSKKPDFVQLLNEEYSQKIIGTFKIPLPAPMKNKRKDVPAVKNGANSIQDDYYPSTQDVYNDLCSQAQYSPEIINKNNYALKNKCNDNNRSASYVLDCIIGSKISCNEIAENHMRKNVNNDDDDDDDNVNVIKQVSNPSKNKEVASMKKNKRKPSDSSDVESTPKKGTSLKFTDSDLPNSQEIKKSVNMNSKCDVDVFSSDSETENNSQDDDVKPLLFHKKKKRKIDAKLNLTKRLEAEALPTRIITRVRKPTKKSESNKNYAAILTPKFLTEQEDDIDKEIITENISRLKTKSEKSKNNTKVLNKLNIKTDKEPEKQDARAETSKTLKSKAVDKKSTLAIKEDTTNKSLKTSNSGVESKSTSLRTRSRNGVSNVAKNDKHKLSEDIKRKTNKTHTKSKLANTFIELQEVDQSKASLDSTGSSNLNSRKTRSSGTDKVEIRSLSPRWALDEVKTKRTYRKRTKKTPDKETEQINSTEKPSELRRSRRIKTTKDVKDNNPTVKPKSILKPSVYDESVVYNKSSESINSPNSLKRSAIKEYKVPSPKRARSANVPNCSLRPPKTHRVLFTTFPEEGVQSKLEKMGAVTVTDVRACTVVLTSGLRRTFKLLCAVGLGQPVVGRPWVDACIQTNAIVDPWSYLLKDEEVEKRFRFNLERTLLGKRNYLKGFTVSSTPSVLPAAPEMKQIVECSGGVWGEGGGRWVVVSTPRDAELWPAFRLRGATLVSSEFVLEGVLRQIPDVQAYLYK